VFASGVLYVRVKFINNYFGNACKFYSKGRNSESGSLFISFKFLILTLLTWRIWWAPNSASKWQMGFNSAFTML